ncbi:MAG: imidazole glycerol phosphate synthase subunit HisH [Halanaerobiaceae bacterium]
MIAVIDYGVGNLGSVIKALKYIGAEVKLTGNPEIIREAGGVVLPGVGAFGEGMKNLRERGLEEVVRETSEEGKPLLGICLGLQLFASYSEEAPDVEGLGLIKGTVRRFDENKVEKIPHMGWNQVKFTREDPLFASVRDESNFYFVHGYYVDPRNEDVVLGLTEYGDVKFTSVVARDNLWGIQCHPEKSSKIGLKVLKNYTRVVEAWK